MLHVGPTPHLDDTQGGCPSGVECGPVGPLSFVLGCRMVWWEQKTEVRGAEGCQDNMVIVSEVPKAAELSIARGCSLIFPSILPPISTTASIMPVSDAAKTSGYWEESLWVQGLEKEKLRLILALVLLVPVVTAVPRPCSAGRTSCGTGQARCHPKTPGLAVLPRLAILFNSKVIRVTAIRIT